MSLKIAFLGAKDIGASCFQYLLESAPQLGFEVCALRSRKGKQGERIKQIARQAAIPILESLEQLPEVDILYSVQHHEILQQKDIDKAGKMALNLHLAPLPEYRGCNQFSYAILDEAKEFGVTIHQMDVRIDHGAILFEKRFPVMEGCWVNDLYGAAVQEGLTLFKERLPDIISGNFQLQPQNSLKGRTEGRLHFRNEIETLKEIPLDLPKNEIEKRIRATFMPGFEPPYAYIGNRKVYFSTE